MSVTLHGRITCREDGEKVIPDDWRGYWRFSKDKSSQQQYSYKRIGQTVRRELVEFTSFLTEVNPTVASGESLPQLASGNSSSKRKAGRPFKKSNKAKKARVHATKQDGEGGSEHQEPAGNSDLNAQTSAGGSEAAEERYESCLVESARRESCDEDDLYSSSAGISTAVAAAESTTCAGRPVLPAEIDLNVSHPMVGMWSGSFEVAQPHGETASIEEEFFLYSLMTEDRQELLEQLPPEPLFPFTVVQSKVKKYRKSNIVTREGKEALRQSTDSAEAVQFPVTGSPTETLLAIEGNAVVEGESSSAPTDAAAGATLDIGDASRTSFTATAAAVLKSEAPMDDSGEIDSNVAALAMYSKLHAEELRNCVVLVGFGSNMYGRFSISGLFDHSTNEFSCEKKYLTNKYSAKRGRRSFAECAAVAAIEGHPNPFSVNASPRPAPPSLRQRTHSTSFAFKDADDDESPIPRKRASPAAETDSARAKPVKGRAETAAAAAQKKVASREAKEAANAAAAAARAAALCGVNETAIVGKRNPDNDDPAYPYREAFMDCDTGEVYEGGWAYGCRYGRGVCIYSDGLMYEGNWVLGKEQGKGCLMTGDRRIIYEGDWFDGFMHGTGKYYFGNGDIYDGDWREGTRHGRGEYTCHNGCRYMGEWRDNKRSGKGTFWWADGGSFYSGEWENDHRHGRGRLELVNGFSYDGSWLHNEIEGKGVCRFPSGQEYEGTFKSGLREGRGTVSFPEGAVYEGRFREDKFDGQGTLKIIRTIPGAEPDELMIPVQIQSDFWRIHFKAGYGNDVH